MNMAYTFYYVVALLLHLITYHRIVIATSFTRSTTSSSTKLSLRLIHRHSIIPPPSHTLSDNDDIRAPLIAMDDATLFLVNISIGEPPVPQLLAMDTGSNLIWVHCTRCTTCKKTTQIFHPEKSSSYTKISNTSRLCYDYDENPSYINGPKYESQCSFGVEYGDKSTSNGVLALEKFTFLTSTGGTVEIPNVVLGCALDAGGPVGDFNGIFGLEVPNEHYFISHTGNNRFSYCIGNIRDTGYMYNQLILGDGAILQGMSTPMRTKNHHYVVTIEGISIGEKNLMINPYDFYFSVVIDSGTTFMVLMNTAYEQLVGEVRGLMDGILSPMRNGGDSVCYYGDLERDLKGFPIVSLHLAEGAEIDLDAEGLFKRTGDGSGFCMAVIESKSENVIGLMAQQYYNVGFNLDSMRVSFQRIDCELLED